MHRAEATSSDVSQCVFFRRCVALLVQAPPSFTLGDAPHAATARRPPPPTVTRPPSSASIIAPPLSLARAASAQPDEKGAHVKLGAR